MTMNTLKHPHRLALALLVVLALVAAACGGDDDDSVAAGDDGSGDGTTTTSEPGDGPDFFGSTEWILVVAAVDGEPLVLLDSHPVTLRRTGDDIGGTAACNGYSGTFVNRGGLFDGFSVTEMACDPPAALDLESAYLAALLRTDTAALDGATLVLTGDGVELRFEAVAPIADADLQGTEWMLDTLIDGETASSIISGTNPQLTFDGSVISGTDGCNSLEGSFEIDGDTIRIGSLAATLRGCQGGIARQADMIGQVLSGSPTFSIEGDRLTLAGSDGLALRYRAG